MSRYVEILQRVALQSKLLACEAASLLAASAKLMRQLFFLLAVIGAFVPLARGAIVVGANGSGILSFATRPAASEWSTRSITGSDVLFANSNDLNNAVQTNASAVSINTQVLDAGGATPPGQNTVAAWSSGGTGGLWTRPTANGATLLMATLMNATGADQNALRIAYTLGQSGGTPAEQAPAHQVYYSFTGELGSWVNIPGLSGGAAGARSNVIVFATPWTNGAPLYVLWIDDNATGGVDRGYSIDDISFAPTTGLGLEVIPDKVVDVLSVLLFRARITESNGPGTQFTYSLGPGAPETARINPTNGLFHWRPARTDAGTTNPITIRATENGGSMLAATQTFNISVREYVEISMDSTVAEAGRRTNVLIWFDSTVALTNLSFELRLPVERFADVSFENLSPSVTNIVLEGSFPPYPFFPHFFALPGQSLIGSQQLARVHFTLVATQASALVPLQPRDVFISPQELNSPPTLLANDGRVVVVSEEPLLESFQTNGVRSLTLYGKPGRNYSLEISTNLSSWQFWQLVTLTNLFQTIDASAHTNLSTVLYRAVEGTPAPSLDPIQAPVEFKAATKLNKRKIAAALKRHKRLHSPLPSPDLIP